MPNVILAGSTTLRLFIEDSFDSAHFLPRVPEDHKCHCMHGHTYRVRLEIEGSMMNEMGWIVDYSEVKHVWEPIKSGLDHHCLNDISGLENPTCEMLAMWIFGKLAEPVKAIHPELRLRRIEIRETEKCGVVLEC